MTKLILSDVASGKVLFPIYKPIQLVFTVANALAIVFFWYPKIEETWIIFFLVSSFIFCLGSLFNTYETVAVDRLQNLAISYTVAILITPLKHYIVYKEYISLSNK